MVAKTDSDEGLIIRKINNLCPGRAFGDRVLREFVVRCRPGVEPLTVEQCYMVVLGNYEKPGMGLVICDGCNVRWPHEHICHGDNSFVGGEETGIICECINCRDGDERFPDSAWVDLKKYGKQQINRKKFSLKEKNEKKG